MEIMYSFMRRTNKGEGKNDPHPTLIEVTEKSMNQCSQFLIEAQARKKGMPPIKFSSVLRGVRQVAKDLDTGIHHIVYKRRRVYSGKAAMDGHNTRLVFFLYDADRNKLMFCGFLRSFLRDGWEVSRGEVQTGITVVEANEDVSRAKTRDLAVA